MIKLLWNLLSRILPKKKDYWVFYPQHNRDHFSGNIKAMSTYAVRTKDVAIIASNRDMARKMESYGIKPVLGKFSKFWAFLRAEIIFVEWMPSLFANGKFKFVQLWHGTGFKNIGLTWDKPGIPFEKRLEEYKKQYENCLFIVANSESDLERKNASFGVKKSVITGTPRNDLFFQNSDIFDIYRKKYGLDGFHKIISYTPTYRDIKTIGGFTAGFWRNLHYYLEETNTVFVVKRHPLDNSMIVPKGYPNIKDLTHYVENVQELLTITDILITDYSGIMTDFAITERPILLYTYDFEEYLSNCRSFYFDFKTTLPRPFVKNEDDLLEMIKDDNWKDEREIKDQYTKFKKTFHKFLDGNSCLRVMDEIERLQQ